MGSSFAEPVKDNKVSRENEKITGPLHDADEKEADYIAESFSNKESEKKWTRRAISNGTGTPDNSGFSISGKSSRLVSDTLKSSGRPIDDSVRVPMESWFNHDFRGVRIHDDSKASESAKAVKAIAYTVGRDIVFRNGAYAPRTYSGSRLLAHELAHVVQQGGNKSLQRKPDGSDAGEGSAADSGNIDKLEDSKKFYQLYRSNKTGYVKVKWGGFDVTYEKKPGYDEALKDAGFESVSEYEQAIAEFENFFCSHTCKIASEMLLENEKLVTAETERYGLPDKDGDDKALLQLGALIKPMLDKAWEYREKAQIRVPLSGGGDIIDGPCPEADQLDKQVNDIILAASMRFPALADPAISRYMLASGNIGQIRGMLKGQGNDRLKDIKDIREKIEEDPSVVWGLENAVARSRMSLNIDKDSVCDLIISDKISCAAVSKIVRDLFLAALAIGIGIATAGAGTPAIIAAAGALSVAGISTYVAVDHTKEFLVQQAAYGSAYDKAKALTANEPDMLWLALDIIAAGIDVAAAARAVAKLAPVIREVLAGAKDVKVIKEEALAIAEVNAKDAEKIAETAAKAIEKQETNTKLLKDNKKLVEAIRAAAADLDDSAIAGILKMPEGTRTQLLKSFGKDPQFLRNLGHAANQSADTIKAAERLSGILDKGQFEIIMEHIVNNRSQNTRDLLRRIGEADFTADELKDLLKDVKNLSGKKTLREGFKKALDDAAKARIEAKGEAAAKLASEADVKLLEENKAFVSEIKKIAPEIKDNEIAGILKLNKSISSELLKRFSKNPAFFSKLGGFVNSSSNSINGLERLFEVIGSSKQFDTLMERIISSKGRKVREVISKIGEADLTAGELENLLKGTEKLTGKNEFVSKFNASIEKAATEKIEKAEKLAALEKHKADMKLLDENTALVKKIRKTAANLDDSAVAGIIKLPDNMRSQILERFGKNPVVLGNLGHMANQSADSVKAMVRLSEVLGKSRFETIMDYLMSLKNENIRDLLRQLGKADFSVEELKELLKGTEKLTGKRELAKEFRSALQETSKARIVTNIFNKLNKLLPVLRGKYPILKTLDEAALKRVIEKIAYVSEIKDAHIQQMKGQLFEELLSVKIKASLETGAGRAGLGLENVKETVEFIPGYKIKINGEQYTDGLLVIRDPAKKELKVVAIVEAKAGEDAAAGLADELGSNFAKNTSKKSMGSLSKLSFEEMSEYKKVLVEEILEVKNTREFFFKNYRDLIEKFFPGKFKTPDEFATLSRFGARKMFDDLEVAEKVGSDIGLSTSEVSGQVRRDIERGYDVLGTNVTISEGAAKENWKVVMDSPKSVKTWGGLPKDVYENSAKSLTKEITDQGLNFEGMSVDINESDLMSIACDLKSAVE